MPIINVSRLQRMIVGAFLIIAAVASSWLVVHKFEIDTPIPANAIVTDSGFGYLALAPSSSWLQMPSDDSEHQRQSPLALLEDGRPLGPAHSFHDVIRNQGAGAFSHYGAGNGLFFSASDNTDPRQNGRRYSVRASVHVKPWLWWTSLIVICCVATAIGIVGLSLLVGLALKLGIERQAPQLAYRRDIDGLRAIAVTTIVLFHLGFRQIPGGFVGVDVFFVISGYLITGIITREIEQGRFSFFAFYQRRIRRIYPALVVVLASTLFSGMLLLLPGDYGIAAASATYAVAAISNFYFLFHTGYFDPKADLMPLLHTWSLGVEEQFYLVWPVMLFCAALFLGRKRRSITSAMLVIAAFSFGANLLLTSSDPKAAFFLPYTRAWEFCAGAAMALVAAPRIQASRACSEIAAAVGLICIATAALFFSADTPFPGVSALLPVAGAALLIAPFKDAGLIRSALSTRVPVFIGAISYSLYLWHWPIITLYRHYHLSRAIDDGGRVVLLALMIMVAWLSWRFVEQPFRRSTGRPWITFGTAIAAASIIAVAAQSIVLSHGFPSRIAETGRPYASLEEMTTWKCPQEVDVPYFGTYRKMCALGAPWGEARAHGFLMGDSHAEHFAPILDMAARQVGVALLRPSWVCMPLIGVTSIKRYFPSNPNYFEMCSELNGPVIEYLRKEDGIDFVAVAAAWSYYVPELYKDGPPARSDGEKGLSLLRDGIDELTARLEAGDRRRVVILSDISHRLTVDVACFMKSSLLREPCLPETFVTPLDASVRIHQPQTDDIIRSLPLRNSHVLAVIPQDAQCDAGGCRAMVNGELIYRDDSHLRMNLSEKTKADLVDLFRIREVLESAASTASGSALAKH